MAEKEVILDSERKPTKEERKAAKEAVKRAKSNHLVYCKQMQAQRSGLNK